MRVSLCGVRGGSGSVVQGRDRLCCGAEDGTLAHAGRSGSQVGHPVPSRDLADMPRRPPAVNDVREMPKGDVLLAEARHLWGQCFVGQSQFAHSGP